MSEAMAAWSAPECPFKIEYATEVLEDIRLAVMDAFFSLPRGGAEIGGILLGKPDRGRLTITGYVPLECEHAFGPSFVLSPNDHRRLSETLAAHRRGQGGIVAVGWYHSHTRSEIFLTDVDVEIHERYFPEPWQVALVLKPHAFQPMRGGFFFRGEGGSIRSESSYQEFKLEGATVKRASGPGKPPPAPGDGAPRAPEPAPPPPVAAPVDDRAAARAVAKKLLERSGVFDAPAEPPQRQPEAPPFIATPPPPLPPASTPPPPLPPVAPSPRTFARSLEELARPAEPLAPEQQPAFDPPAPEAPAEPEHPPLKAPEFLLTQPKPSRRWLTVAIALVGGLGLGAAAYQTRGMWLPRITALWQSGSAVVSQPASTGLQTVDLDGQLQIRWDRNSAAVQSAHRAVLTIRDTGTPLAVELDKEHLLTGSFTYGRQGERVDVTLALHGSDGQVTAREASTYLGKLPARAPADDPQVRKERDDLAKKADTLSKDLNAQRARTQKLERSLEDIKTEVRREQRRRMENQVPDK